MNAQGELLKGVYTLFKSATGAGTIYNDVSGRFYEGIVPQGVPKPFIQVGVATHLSEWTFDKDIENILVEFKLVGIDKDAIHTMADHLTTLFDRASPTVTGYFVESFNRENVVSFEMEDHHIQVVEYVVRLLKT
jgi:hypothetical protein